MVLIHIFASKFLCKKNNKNVLTYKYKNDKLDLILLKRFCMNNNIRMELEIYKINVLKSFLFPCYNLVVEIDI